MKYNVIGTGGSKYIEVITTDTPLRSEQDALGLISLSFEHESPYLFIHDDALSEDFFKLRTGVAGMMLQKFTNYHIKTAVITTNQLINEGRFQELMKESNKGDHFRVLDSAAEAEQWFFDSK